MKKIFSSLPCAYLLFRFYLLVFNVTIQKIIVICCVAIYVLLNFQEVFEINNRKRFSSNVILISLFVALIIIVPIISGTADFSFARKMLTMYLNLLCWTAFAIHVKKISNNSNDGDVVYTLTDEYGRVISLYVVFSVCCILEDQFHEHCCRANLATYEAGSSILGNTLEIIAKIKVVFA